MGRMRGASVRSTVLAGLLALLALCCVCPLLAAPATAAGAQPRDKPISAFYREIWTTRQGLPHNQVNAIDQTPDGYLWLGTWEGLVRYNGLEFQIFDRKNTPALKDNGIRSVRASADGAVVIGTSRGGVTIKRGDDWQTLREEDGLAQDEIMDAVLDRQGRLWVATESAGITRIDGGQVAQFNSGNGLPGDITYGLLLARDDTVWAATAAGLVRFVDGRPVRVGQAAGLPDAPVFRVIQLANGDLVAGTERGAYRGRNGRFVPLSPLLPMDGIPSLAEDIAGNLWVGTVNNGLLRLSGKGVERFSTQRGLPNNRVAALQVDREGSLWAGTNAGLLRLSDTPFTTWNGEQGLSDDYVRALAENPTGGVWIGTGRGLNLWRENRIAQSFTAADGLPGDSILSLLVSSDGSLLVGSYTVGVYRMRNGKVVEHHHNANGMPGSNQVRALVEGRDGALWIGTTRGLVRLRDGVFKLFGSAEGLPRDFIISLHRARDGSIWVGTTNGAARIVGDKVSVLGMQVVNGAQDVFGFHEDADGTLWMATDRGLVRHRDGVLRFVGVQHGLPVDTLFAVVDDGRDNLWLTSNRGVLRVAREAVEAVMDGKATRVPLDHFGEADGLVSAQANGGSGPAALMDRDGAIWVATARGAASVAPDLMHLYRHELPRVVLEQVLANDVSIPLAPVLQLPPGTRKLEFRYAALSFLTPRFLQYRYRLDGMDGGWIERGNQRVAQYTNLPAGKYRFDVNVSAPSLGHGWSDDVTSIQIEIAPQLWQRKSFLVALGIALLLLAYGAIRWRLGSLRKRASHLEGVVRQRTQDLRAQTDRLQQSDAEKSSLLERLRVQSEAFERMALEDELTGIGNRRNLDTRLGQVFHDAVASGQPMSLALFDIDDFKQVNDTFGHAYGDAVLREIAIRTVSILRTEDFLFRWGGEEFLVVLRNCDLPRARGVAEKVRHIIADSPITEGPTSLSITITVGLSQYNGGSIDDLINRADEALYVGKRNGKNMVVVGE